MTALRALLAGIVDYAGLFPPAALDMPGAVRSYASYRTEDEAWMLARFVVPVARLDEFIAARDTLAPARAPAQPDPAPARPEWRLSALVGADVVTDLARARKFNRSQTGRSSIDSMEVRVATVEAIGAISAASAKDPFSWFAEIPLEPDPERLVAAIHDAGISAKIRTGGVTPDAIPSPSSVVRVMRRCIEAGVRFKATAGLHHPLRAEHPLTYDHDGPVGLMYGYLNLFLAAAFMHEGMSDADAGRLLEERDAQAIAVTPGAIGWEDFRIAAAEIRRVRNDVAVSFGSCSFREPVDELRSLGFTD